MKRFQLPPKAVECGSDLRKLTAREMIGAFLSLRGRHYSDVPGKMLEADSSYALARVLFPRHRKAYISAMEPMLERGAALFNRDELGHPDTLFRQVDPDHVRPPAFYSGPPQYDVQPVEAPAESPAIRTVRLSVVGPGVGAPIQVFRPGDQQP